MGYRSLHHYTPVELDEFARQDLENDAVQSEFQALVGPYYPENGVTEEMLNGYAKKCRALVKKYEGAPGLHNAVLKGEA
jgi:hypothetical protein